MSKYECTAQEVRLQSSQAQGLLSTSDDYSSPNPFRKAFTTSSSQPWYLGSYESGQFEK